MKYLGKIIGLLFMALIITACGSSGGGDGAADGDDNTATPAAGSSNWDGLIWGRDNWS